MNDSQIDEAEQRIGLYRDGLVDTLARLKVALSNAQEVIHLSQCREGDVGGNKECWKECREARDALLVAEGATS